MILGSLLGIERAAHEALCGIAPNRLVWGPLQPLEFLQVLADITTWALTHFEPVRAWSVAEDLTASEEQEGYGLHRSAATNVGCWLPHRAMPAHYERYRASQDPGQRSLGGALSHVREPHRCSRTRPWNASTGQAKRSNTLLLPGRPPLAQEPSRTLAIRLPAAVVDRAQPGLKNRVQSYQPNRVAT